MSIVKSINDAKNAEIQVHLLKGSANKAKHRSIGTFATFRVTRQVLASVVSLCRKALKLVINEGVEISPLKVVETYHT